MITIRRRRLIVWVPLFCLASLGFAWLQFRPGLRQRDFPLFTLPAKHNRNTTSVGANTTSIGGGPSLSQHDPALIPFWDSVSRVLLDAKPPCSLPEDEIKAPVTKFASLKKGSNARPDLLKLSQKDVESLRDARSRFVAQVPQLARQMPYVRGTQGIVTTAAGDYLPVLIVSLRMLRRTGSKLPVQVFVENWDVYEKDICEEVLPALNAQCFVVSDVLDAVPRHVEIATPRFQLRTFAMLFSPFDEMLLLDADSVTAEQPEQWLNAEPFILTGFVSWPDYVGCFATQGTQR